MRPGRPSVSVDAKQVIRLRASGQSWRTIAKFLGVACTTARRAALKRAKSVPKISLEAGADAIPQIAFNPGSQSLYDASAEDKHEAGEAALFLRLVRIGRISLEEADETIGVPPETRARLLRFAEEQGGYCAMMVRQAVVHRDRVLAEFRRHHSRTASE
jgi:hypothetical protein